MKTRILLADDHRIMREGLKSLLNDEPDMEVVGEAENGRKAIEMTDELSPDVVVMDIGMPELNGIEATRRIVLDHPDTKVVALSMHSDRRFMAEILKAGAAGYLLKDGAFEELAGAIRTVVAKKMYLSPRIADVVVEDYVRNMPRSRAQRLRRADAARAGGAPAPRRRQGHQAGRRVPAREREDGGDAPPPDHDEAGHPQRRGADEVRDPRGADDVEA